MHKIEIFPNKCSFISGSHDKNIRIWNLNDLGGECVETLLDDDGNGIRCLKLVNEGQYLISSSFTNLTVWDVGKGERLNVLRSHWCEILCLELFSVDDEHLLASADQGGNILLWNLKTMTMKTTMHAHKGDILCLKVIEIKIYIENKK